MNTIKIKLFTAIFAAAIVAGVCVFYACKKEELVKNTTQTEWKEKIEYMKTGSIFVGL